MDRWLLVLLDPLAPADPQPQREATALEMVPKAPTAGLRDGPGLVVVVAVVLLLPTTSLSSAGIIASDYEV